MWADKHSLSAANCTDWVWGPPRILCGGYRGSFLEVKQLGCGIYHSAASSAEVKNEWCYTFTLPVCLCGMERYNFIQSTTDCYQASSLPFFALSHVCKFNVDRIKNKIVAYVPSSF
jgi:hypothetical protein